MKKNFSLVLFSFILFSSKAQYPLADAITLKTYTTSAGGKIVFNGTNKDKILMIVAKYVDANGDPGNVLSTNPFLKDIGFSSRVTLEATVSPDLTDNAGAPKTGASIIIDGISRFIVERIKKELEASFFESFYSLIQKDKYRDCRTLFPNTYNLLLAISDQVYNYEIYLASLREQFGKDLQIILPHLESVISSGQFADFFNAHRELKSLCLTGIFIAKRLKSGDHIGTILEQYDPYNPEYSIVLSDENENTLRANVLKFCQEVSKSLKTADVNSKRYWAEEAELNQLKDPVVFNLFIGLLYERVKNIHYGKQSEETFGQLLINIKDKKGALQDFIENVSVRIKACENSFYSIQSKPQADRKVEEYINYFNSITDLLNTIRVSQPFREMGNLVTTEQILKIDKIWEVYDLTVSMIDKTSGICINIKNKKYAAVLGDVLSIYQMAFDKRYIDVASKKEIKNIDLVLDFIIEYGGAFSEITEAKDSKGVYEVLDRVAAPVGSSRVKKENVLSVSLNAYGGGFIGKENIEGVKDNKKFNNYGIAAPVGIAVSLGRIGNHNENPSRGNKSLTLFVSVIDLGAPVSFRFQNDTLDEVPTIKWRDVISPGAHLIYGFGKVPLSLAAGFQAGPNLRKVSSQFNEFSNSKYWRYSVGLYVDIPIFIFHKRKYW